MHTVLTENCTADGVVDLARGWFDPSDQTDDALLAVMRNGEALGARGRYSQIGPAVARSFDIPFMTRVAVGPGWTGLSPRDPLLADWQYRLAMAHFAAGRLEWACEWSMSAAVNNPALPGPPV